ncbi:LacI family transcriptional regulator [Micromonospora sp. KC606]|uniref:LacI family DNA-binding transcriptional regulator n=1 Tax=Micromonospora sp. KC606 TaxID=2530379 RepID=UPI001043D8C0|nr:LacI family DNA-binding transcriptional regulator [Micromonospora sp. KC606]TDC81782.1 LacI family transcriptional regulator [Micromonospora sp. KC606]
MDGPTLHDVAARSGVSIKTVSNVLRGTKGKVSAATAARVYAAIEELNYRPNLSARRLRTGRSDVIALVVPDLRNPYFAEVATAMIGAARQAGYTLLIDETGGDPDVELSAAEGLYDPLIEGVIMSPLTLDQRQLGRRSRSIPLVLLGERDYSGPCDHVMFDNIEASYQITGHLVEQGYSRIAVIGRQDDPPHATAVKRLKGYHKALRAAGLRSHRALAPVVPGAPYSKTAGAQAAHQLLRQEERPDAIYCFADVLAIGALRAAHEHGLHAPADFGLAGFDGVEEGRFTIPTLTTIAPDFADMAALAVSALAERIRSTAGIEHRDIRCRYELVIGESSRRSPASAPAS